MNLPKTLKPKNPLIALLLSLLYPGLGHLYLGKNKKAYIFLTAVTIVIGGALFLIAQPIGDSNIYLFLAPPLILLLEITTGIGAYTSAQRSNTAHGFELRPPLWQEGLIGAAMIFSVFYFNIFWFIGRQVNDIIQICKVSSSSMQPTLMKGEVCFIDKSIYRLWNPKPGDIVVFNSPEDMRYTIKRFIAKEKQIVEIKEGKVYVNDTVFTGPGTENIHYANHGAYGAVGHKIMVPPGHYFVLGDNSASSRDSRTWGFLPNGYLVGKIYKSYFPFNQMGNIFWK